MGSSPNGGFFIQSAAGEQGNFEVVVPWEQGGLAHFTRMNDARDVPWTRPVLFGSNRYVSTCLLQTDFKSSEGKQFNLEVMAVTDEGDIHVWVRDNGPDFTWNGPGPLLFAPGVWGGSPNLVQAGTPQSDKTGGYRDSPDSQDHPPFILLVLGGKQTGGFQFWARAHYPDGSRKWFFLAEKKAAPFVGAGMLVSSVHNGDPRHENSRVYVNVGDNVVAATNSDGNLSLYNLRAGSGSVSGGPDLILGPYLFGDQGWRTWFQLGDDVMAPSGSVTPLIPFDGHIDLYTTRADGVVMSTFYNT
jgi:hypothetical protein